MNLKIPFQFGWYRIMCRWGPTIRSLWQMGTSLSTCKFAALWTLFVWWWFKLNWWNKLSIDVIKWMIISRCSNLMAFVLFCLKLTMLYLRSHIQRTEIKLCLLGCFCLFGFSGLFWFFFMNISQSAAVFYDAVAPSVKDFPTTCLGQNALALLRHSREILPLCVHLVGKWKHWKLPWSVWEMLPHAIPQTLLWKRGLGQDTSNT